MKLMVSSSRNNFQKATFDFFFVLKFSKNYFLLYQITNLNINNMSKIYLFLIAAMFSVSTFGQTTITFQPNSTVGKDAFVWDYNPNNNYGSTDEYTIYAWTYNGTPSIRRCLIDFDFSAIPSNAVITNAELILFNDPNSPSTNGEHSQLSGSNEMIVQRVINSWNEQS